MTPTWAGRVRERRNGRRSPWWRVGVAWGLVTLFATCDNGSAAPEEETIPREAFIEAYVALREVGLRSPQQLISEEERERILGEQGVTEEELFAFVDVHGNRVEFMRDVWNDIEERLEEMRTQRDDSTAGSPADPGTDARESRS